MEIMSQNSRKTPALTAFVVALVALAAFAANASALPARFWGVVPQAILSQEQFKTLATGGVQSIRLPLTWAATQPTKGSAYEWTGFDEQVEHAAKANIEVLPFFVSPPTWAV